MELLISTKALLNRLLNRQLNRFRNPNHLEIKEFIRSTIPAILNEWSLGTTEDIKFDDQGWVNVTAFVNDRYVLRLNARDMQLP